jgi:hypothetical protein
MVGSLLLGGGTRGGYLSDAILELLAIPPLLLVVSSLIDLLRGSTRIRRSTRWALILCFAIAVLPLLQLVPLPPWIWTKLPGREAIVSIFGLVGGQGNWMPVSVSPSATWLSFLSLLPPMAVFLGAIQLSYWERRRLSLVVISVGIVSAFLGLLQVAQGPSSPLRFFQSNMERGEAVGFFLNRNDFAALLYVVLLFAGPWAIYIALKAVSWKQAKRAVSIVMLTAAFLGLIVLIATEAMAHSRAGIVLTIVAVAGIFAMASGERRNVSGIGPSKLLVGATLLAVMLVVQFTLYRILDRFAVDPLQDERVTFAHETAGAAAAFLPFGAGVGTFVPVYAMFEEPGNTIANFYINRAHNEFLEGLLETGLFGVALFGVFMIVLGFRSVELWWRPPDKASELDRLLMRAATLAIPLLIAHSFVEYPLRTGAMMAIFAFSCALLIDPFAVTENAMMAESGRVSVPRRQAESLPKTKIPLRSTMASPATAAQSTETSQPLARQTGRRWGEDIAWPTEWQKSKVQNPLDVPSQSGGAASSQSGDGAAAPSQSDAAVPSQTGGLSPSRSGEAGPETANPLNNK